MASDSQKTKLILLFGGKSAEHTISCITATHIFANTNKDVYDIELIAITKDNAFVRPDPSQSPLAAEGEPIDFVASLNVNPDTVVFPILHGPLGEDGTMQGLLEIFDVAYTGPGVLASALAMDKAMFKTFLDHHGIQQAKWKSFSESDYVSSSDEIIASCITDLKLPCFVKPANMGSSIGVSKAKSEEELRKAFEAAFVYDEVVIVEETIVGREIELAVLGNQEPEVSTPGEILAAADFYDYKDKYFDGKSQSVIPATLPSEAVKEMQTIAIDAYKKLGLEGLSRADFLYEENGRGIFLNEFNTMPGFTPISMYPKLWENDGLSYSDLIDKLIELAQERYSRRSVKRVTDVL